MKPTTYPTRCPSCSGIDIETEHENEDEVLFQTCSCNSCFFEWVCIYDFAHWQNSLPLDDA